MKIIRKSINELNELKKNEIDNFIKLNNGLIFHETKFNEIASGIFNTDLFYFLANIDNKLIGLCPAHSIKRGILNDVYSNNGSFEIPYGGWVIENNFTDLKSLWKKLSLRCNESLTYWSSFLNNMPESLKKKGKEYQTGLINLHRSEKELFDNVILSKRRNMLRKAEKAEIIIKKNAPEELHVFFDMMHRMHKKAGIKEISNKYYEDIINSYMPSGNVTLMIAYLYDRPLSGVIILGNSNAMHYWQGASGEDVPNYGQGELLQWEAIKWAKSREAKLYDLCVIEAERLPQIAHFKMGFCKNHRFYCLSKKALLFRAINKIQNVITN